MYPITNEQLLSALSERAISRLTDATIRQICAVAANLEQQSGEPMIHLELGNPGLPATKIGVEAEIEALHSGVSNKYPVIDGIPPLKKAGQKFVKAFLDVDIKPGNVIPTVGSMQGSFTLMLLLKHRDVRKDTMLFINPGFQAQPTQAYILGLKQQSFDLYNYRGKKLEEKLEEILSKGNVTGLLYSNPNNPAWTNLTDEELEIIGRMATKHDVIVLEDLAYMGMDFRTDLSRPYEPPFVSTVAKYTDNYILMISGSKIFSYAGQRIAIVCISDKVAAHNYQAVNEFFSLPTFVDAYIYGVLYAVSSGTTHSAQFALAAMLDSAADGKLNFINECKEYGRRGELAKKAFTENGFSIVYALDGNEPIGDGFFFTASYPGLDSENLLRELLRYGVAAITLPATGSEQEGIRVCVSMLDSDEKFEILNKRLKTFNNDHKV